MSETKHCWHHVSKVFDLKAGIEHVSHCCYCNRMCVPELALDPQHGKFSYSYKYSVSSEIDAEACPVRLGQS